MGNKASILTIHGYSGTSEDLAPLVSCCRERFGECVHQVALPGHEGPAPDFDKEAFCRAITDTHGKASVAGGKMVILGYSTGGIFALNALVKGDIPMPDLLVLAAVPKSIGVQSLQRWEKHRQGKGRIGFSSVARMVSLINEIGKVGPEITCPVLVVHGEDDALVPVADAHAWAEDLPVGRKVVVAGVAHDLFGGDKSRSVIDIVLRAVTDLTSLDDTGNPALELLCGLEAMAEHFLRRWPHSAFHLAECPSSRNLTGEPARLKDKADTEPVFANIEITTRCNLACRHCARNELRPAAAEMSIETFEKILDRLPHAYRITLVGLGEPLMHPQLVDFVALAAQRRRRVGLVTNAMLLDEKMSEELIAAGLGSIAFSIDAGEQWLAEELRKGSDLKRIAANITTFVALARQCHRLIYTAVFSAVSQKSTPHLGKLIKFVRGIGPKVLMLSDLNFENNTSSTLWKNSDHLDETAIRQAVLTAFSEKLPILSVRGIEEFGLAKRYDKFLLVPPSSLYHRSQLRTWCHSPWQTVPVDVSGNIALCDCQPEKLLGNLLNQSFETIWNGRQISAYREQMLGDVPPKACAICPRF